MYTSGRRELCLTPPSCVDFQIGEHSGDLQEILGKEFQYEKSV